MNLGGLDHDDWAAILFYGAIGLVLARAVPGLFRGRILAGFLALGTWIALFGVALTGYAYRTELNAVGTRVMAVVFPGTVVPTGDREVTVFRQPDGQFSIVAEAGKLRLPFILDTGASTVVLRAEDAVRLGIATRKLSYDIPVSTANGHALTAAVTLPGLAVGSIHERDVDALVARPGALHENLLGMSFLNRLASFTFSRDRVVLRGQ
ncbi:TIGR02281 family clan AA aspartic protease [Lichenihabitans sp. Uapishka_5]|uniref:retropepsin-like aspartic protease family protein n=1 Tax=Lichenihabitans sp. Uapishka_5 TaxID=3037302 RepID=UPI0029E7FAA3|nr:TIGR02281 family clan AA aspartic protease [Lichenihabitans sp. Uapishka_5]MDX7952312.1 TIGR02281 family clan AA aspartic protease [Lichenihabitans sp. Uapishka_5]